MRLSDLWKRRWRRTDEEKAHDTAETATIQARLKYVMGELRSTLDQVEQRLEKEIGHG